jgi:cellulose synthase/poly-beta-1,6-N-acetylglucosamine synthase-like glycosyltransferase
VSAPWRVVDAVGWLAASFTVSVALVSLCLVVLALSANVRYLAAEGVRSLLFPRGRLAAPVTIIVPAYNEAAGIVGSIRSLLQQTYSSYDIVVVDDGSSDGTFAALDAEFDLVAVPYSEPAHPVPCQEILDVWVNRKGYPLRVVRKVNGGKADAQNAGLNVSRTPYVCILDADSVLVRDALDRVLAVFAADEATIAVGAGVGVVNGCPVKDGFVDDIRLPRHPFALFQVLEYLRSFLYGRIGWASLNATLIVSGAFGVFRRDALEAVGGYRSSALAEDLDIIMRLHLHHAKAGERAVIRFLPETLCFTEVPTDRQSLRNQRVRWERGLAEALATNRTIFTARGTGAAGRLAAPYYLFVELLSPLVEVAGLAVLAAAALIGALSWSSFLLFSALCFVTSIVLSVSAVLLDQLAFGVYRRPGQVAILLAAAVLEQLGYRQMTAYWRLRGLITHFRGTTMTWGTIERRPTWQHNAA